MKALFKILFLMYTSSVFADWHKDVEHDVFCKLSVTKNVLTLYTRASTFGEYESQCLLFDDEVVYILRRHSNHSSIDHDGHLKFTHAHITLPGVKQIDPKKLSAFLRYFQFSNDEFQEILTQYKVYFRLQSFFISNWIPLIPDDIPSGDE